MSAGFRLFLLILASFGAIYSYRVRYPELSRWLKADSPPQASGFEDGLVSPVDSVLERDVSLARLVLRSPPRRPPVALPEELSLPEGAELEAADLANVSESLDDAAEPVEGILREGATDEEPAPSTDNRPIAQSDPATEAQPAAPPRYEEVEYKVESGDNLWKIAQKKLGSGSRFGEIRETNPELFKGRGGDVVQVGTVLRIRIPIREEILKDASTDADSTVEGNTALRSLEPRRKPSRQSVKQPEKSRQVAQP